jgi:dephospho-CoA kinase
MKQIFLIGGMGAGKSTARKALTGAGLPYIDLDKVGHEVLKWDSVKEELSKEFSPAIFDEEGEINRTALAAEAFESPAATRRLNCITMPRIEECYMDALKELETTGAPAVVVEYSVFRNRQSSLAYGADVVVAVLAPLDMRIERAVASGFEEEDVRARIAQQITDAERIDASDVVFNNDGTPDELRNEVLVWWDEYSKTLN